MPHVRNAFLIGAAAALLVGAAPARADIIYATAETGFGGIDLTTFDANQNTLTLGFVPTRATGPATSVGFGVRLGPVSLGGRATNLHFSDPSVERTAGSYDLWSIDAEVGLRLFPVGRVEPYIFGGAGYSVFGGLDDAISGTAQGLDIDGFNLRGGVGVDVRPIRALSLGMRLGGEMLAMNRKGVPLRDLGSQQQVNTIGEARSRVLQASGSSIGSGWSLTAVLGFHL